MEVINGNGTNGLADQFILDQSEVELGSQNGVGPETKRNHIGNPTKAQEVAEETYSDKEEEENVPLAHLNKGSDEIPEGEVSDEREENVPLAHLCAYNGRAEDGSEEEAEVASGSNENEEGEIEFAVPVGNAENADDTVKHDDEEEKVIKNGNGAAEEVTALKKEEAEPVYEESKKGLHPYMHVRGRSGLRSSGLDSSFRVRSEPSSPMGMPFPRLRKAEGQQSLHQTRKRARGDVTSSSADSPTSKRQCGWLGFNITRWWRRDNASDEVVDVPAAPQPQSATEALGEGTPASRSCSIM